ncbi:MAG: hypothetical protein M3Z31_06170 [Pseudomonadota bacterium]|nr:hypothetical protein [Pseudomonadota bacterium]
MSRRAGDAGWWQLGAGVLLALSSLLAVAAPGPQFFTYYGLGTSYSEARDHVNLFWAVSWTGNAAEVAAELREAKAAGVKAMLHTEFPFFSGSCPYAVRPDAPAQWRAFASDLAAQNLLETVVAVYPLDEPDLCGVADSDMQAVIKIIHDEPLTRGKKVAGLFTVDVAKKWGGHYRLTGSEHKYAGSVRALDWVGFDCYGCKTIFTETAWDTLRFDAGKPGFVSSPGPTLYDNFKSQLDLSRQQVIVVPKASIGGPLFGSEYDDAVSFYLHASADPDVAMLLPFTWFDQPGGVQGVRSLPQLRATYTAIGRDIDWKHPEASPLPVPRATAFEFYHRTLDHYFVSAQPDEIAALDAGVFTGWARTGQTWKVFAAPLQADLRGSPVCRYYGQPQAGLDSHFYSASTDECAAVATRFSTAWQLESSNVFQVQLPALATGVCPLLTQPVYRLYNARRDANHRFTTSATLRDAMRDSGWVAEGYGSEGVAMCVPT